MLFMRQLSQEILNSYFKALFLHLFSREMCTDEFQNERDSMDFTNLYVSGQLNPREENDKDSAK